MLIQRITKSDGVFGKATSKLISGSTKVAGSVASVYKNHLHFSCVSSESSGKLRKNFKKHHIYIASNYEILRNKSDKSL